MSYFTAVLARDGRRWASHDVDVDSASDLAELTTEVRSLVDDEEPVLVLVEREDAWWAVIRVDGDDDPRVFVSDVVGTRVHGPTACRVAPFTAYGKGC